MSGGLSHAVARGISRSLNRGKKGSGIWLGLGVTLWGMRQLLRLGRRRNEKVYSQKLLPGESLRIDHLFDELGRQ